MNSKSMRSTIVLLFVLSALVLAGCSSNKPNASRYDIEVNLVDELSQAAQTLLTKTAGLNADQPVIATSFVSVDNLLTSSTFGRQASEIFATAMTHTGVPVVEVKLRDSIFIQENTGELMLSRELQHLSSSHSAQAVAVGTYAVGGTHLYVNVRVVRTADSVILGSHNFSLPINRDIQKMLPRN